MKRSELIKALMLKGEWSHTDNDKLPKDPDIIFIYDGLPEEFSYEIDFLSAYPLDKNTIALDFGEPNED